IVSHLRRSLHVKATRRYLADLYHKYNVVILADSWSSSAPVASWDERHQLPAPQSTCFVPERGEPFLPGRRCITGTSLDSLLLQAFIGKIDPDSFDDSFRRDFLKHYLERELLYREAVATRFCETSAIKEALQQQQVISQATATLRCLLPVAEYPVNNGNPTEERLWQLLSAD
ncbi:MAG: hypothetical protein ISR91_07190, partial [Candidatus Delongbacteria bacterium]|nr:hypothetical protein [Candidatus Delongbacteria bacterium]